MNKKSRIPRKKRAASASRRRKRPVKKKQVKKRAKALRKKPKVPEKKKAKTASKKRWRIRLGSLPTVRVAPPLGTGTATAAELLLAAAGARRGATAGARPRAARPRAAAGPLLLAATNAGMLATFDAELPAVGDPVGVFAARSQVNVDGTGITVAVIDSGCNGGHQAFQDDGGTSRVRPGRNFTDVGSSTDTTDGTGHGTAVAGIIAGRVFGLMIAPGAEIVPLRVIPPTGGGDLRFVLNALKWVWDHRNDPKAASVVCLSIGDDKNHKTESAAVTGAAEFVRVANVIRDLRTARIPVVVATGNEYFCKGSQTGMCFPAIVPACISVGAVWAISVDSTEFTKYCSPNVKRADFPQLTPYSQRLPRTAGDAHFTRIFAPGSPIHSVWHKDSSSLTDELHGTSIAAPYVAGVIALLQQRYKTLNHGNLPTCDDIESWLNRGPTISDNAIGQDDSTPTGKKFKYLDALAALQGMPGGIGVGV